MNPYAVLLIAPDASQAEIDKAFRNLARKHHPDAGGDADAFKEINEAYEILSDPERRKQYDETGDGSLRQRYRAAESVIAAMVAEAFAQESQDAILYMKQRIDARRADHQDRRSELLNGELRLRNRIQMFERANESTGNPEGRDFIHDVLTNGLSDLEREKQQHDDQIEVLTLALTLLNGLQGSSATARPFQCKRSFGSHAMREYICD